MAHLFLVAFSAVPSPAFAEGNPPGASPSTGTVVAAALETAGYVSQAQVLEQLKEMLQGLGALIYVGVILSVLLFAVLAGNFQRALWLLLGPPLFFFLIRPTSGVNGVEWQFGAFRDTGDLQKVLDSANIKDSDGEKVSWFFHAYNVLVSDTTQQLIKILTNEQVKPQMMFMARQNIIDDLFAAHSTAPGLTQLIATVNSQCVEEMQAARLVAYGQRNPNFRETPDYKAATKVYCERMKDADKSVNEGATQEYLRDLLWPGGPRQYTNLSCEQLWTWMFQGLQQAARSVQRRSMLDRVYPKAGKNILDQIVKDIEKKLTEVKTDTPAPKTEGPCPEIARVDGTELIPMIFTGWMIQKVFKTDPRSLMLEEPFDQSGIQTAPLNTAADPAKTRQLGFEIQRRYRADQLAEASRFESYTIAKLLPYMQGAGLYMLAVTFPFFALLVLLPGQAGAFFMWLALWAWLKSWDLGWALVMIADDILWSLMPHATYFRIGSNGAGSVISDPITVLEAAFGGDYAYNLSTYYMLVGMMISAVPVLSAHAVLGSKKAIAGVFLDGLKVLGQRFGQVAEHWLGASQNAAIDAHREMGAFLEAKKGVDKMYSQLKSMTQENKTGSLVDMAKAFTKLTAAKASLAAASRRMNNLDSQAEEASGDRPPGDSFPANADFSAGNAEVRQASAAVKSAQGEFDSAVKEASSKNLFLKEVLKGDSGKTWSFLSNVVGGKSVEDALRAAGATPPSDWDAAQANPALPWNKDYGAPTPELEEAMRQIARNINSADLRGGFGETLMVGAGGLQLGVNGIPRLLGMQGADDAVFGRLSGAEEGLGRALMAIGGLGVAMSKDAISMKREVNAMASQVLQLSAQQYYYEAMRSDHAAFYDQLRAGVSGYRVEYWTVPNAPQAVTKDAHQITERLRRHAAGYETETVTNAFMQTMEAVFGKK